MKGVYHHDRPELSRDLLFQEHVFSEEQAANAICKSRYNRNYKRGLRWGLVYGILIGWLLAFTVVLTTMGRT